MNLPRGRLVRSRVVSDPAVALRSILDDGLTGYVVFEPQDTLLLSSDASGVLTFEDGVPVLAYHTGTDRGGASALADLAIPGPYSVDVYELDVDVLEAVNDTRALRVPPDMPADRLAGNPDLADRTRERAPVERRDERRDEADGSADGPKPGAVEAFLADEEKIDRIRAQAREEAKARATEWGLDDELDST